MSTDPRDVERSPVSAPRDPTPVDIERSPVSAPRDPTPVVLERSAVSAPRESIPVSVERGPVSRLVRDSSPGSVEHTAVSRLARDSSPLGFERSPVSAPRDTARIDLERGPVSGPRDPARRAMYLDSVRAERRALGIFAGVAIAAMVWVARPVGVGILLGTLIAFSLQPFYDRTVLKNRRPGLTALGYVIGSTVALLAVLGGLSSLFISRGAVMAQALIAALSPGGALRAVAQRFAVRLGQLHVQPDELAAKARDAAAELASRAATIAGAVATTTFDLFLTLIFMMMTLSLMLRRWPEIALRVENMLPLRPLYTRAILEEFQTVGRTTLLGTVLTGLAQGGLAAIGYWVTGVPEAAFFGAATAIASLVPGVGTLLVWVPAGVFLIATGHPAMGALELAWGSLVVVGASDYIIRPRLVGGHGTMPSLLTFAALFGGVEVFGLAGLILGPLIMSVSFAVLRIFAKDAEERRARGERHA